jgi:hypothetical protein
LQELGKAIVDHVAELYIAAANSVIEEFTFSNVENAWQDVKRIAGDDGDAIVSEVEPLSIDENAATTDGNNSSKKRKRDDPLLNRFAHDAVSNIWCKLKASTASLTSISLRNSWPSFWCERVAKWVEMSNSDLGTLIQLVDAQSLETSSI